MSQKKYAIWDIGIALGVVLLDRWTKRWAQQWPPEGREGLPGLFRLQYTENRGAAFSLLADHPELVTALAALLLVGVAVCFAHTLRRSSGGWPLHGGAALMLGGGIGNLWDRVAHGAVIDFIKLTLIRFPIFNGADIAITVGAALFAIGYWIDENQKARKAVQHAD